MAAVVFRESSVALLSELLTTETEEATLDGVRSTIALILDLHPNHGFIGDCIAFAANLHPLQGGISETEIAERHGMVRGTVCKWVQIVRRELNLPESRGMRSEEARNAYSERAHRVHGTEPQPKKKRMATIESVVSRLCRWASQIDHSSLTPEERAEMKKLLAPLGPVMAAFETA